MAQKENEDLSKYRVSNCLNKIFKKLFIYIYIFLFSQSDLPDLKNKAIYDLDDPDRPKFTTNELKDILTERNNLKTRVSDLEDELLQYRPEQVPMS